MYNSAIMKEYRPELLSRRGEYTAWAATLVSAAGLAVFAITGREPPRTAVILCIFLLFVSLGISLSNWMDRRTVLKLGEQGVAFYNGLRSAEISWERIRRVEVFPSSWGRKVRVIGDEAHFDFRTLGEVRLRKGETGRLGFAKGEEILKRILHEADLKQVETTGGSYYYARE